MPVNDSAKGKSYDPHVYEVGAEKIREYAGAVGEDNPVYFDREAAKEAGFRDVVAPPMFAVVYAWKAFWAPAFDSEVGMDVTKLLHASQDFEWGEPVCSGDTITTELSVKDIYPKGPNGFYVFETVSHNQDGDEVARGTWTNIVRGAAEE